LLKLLISQNAAMKEQILMNTRLLQELVKKQKLSESVATGKLPENMQLPLKSPDDVKRLEQQLLSQELYKQLVCIC